MKNFQRLSILPDQKSITLGHDTLALLVTFKIGVRPSIEGVAGVYHKVPFRRNQRVMHSTEQLRGRTRE